MLKRSRYIRRVQISALILLVISNALNYIDRATIPIATPMIRHDFDLSLSDIGLIMSAFLWTYSFMQLPIGPIVDRLRPRRTLTLGLLIWSGAQAVGSLCTGFGQFVAMRIFLGIGESAQFPSSLRVLRDWYSKRDRGGATGIFSMGSSLGSAVAAPLLTWLMVSYGWRCMFVVMGIVGILLAIGWYVTYRDVDSVELSQADRLYLTDGEVEGHAAHSASFKEWLGLLRYRSTWGIVLGVGFYTYVGMIYHTWLPTYLQMDRHMSIARTGFAASIPFLCGIAGSILGGYLVDLLARRGVSAINSSRIPCIIGVLGLAICTVIAAEAQSTAVAIVAMSVAVFSLYLNVAAAWTLAAAVAPKNFVGSMAGLKGFGGYIGAALAPTVTGFIAQSTHSFHLALLIGAGAGIVSALSFWIGIRSPIDEEELLLWANAQTSETSV